MPTIVESILASPLFSGALGGISVAIVNWLFGKRRSEAEIAKLVAETTRIGAETEKITQESLKLTTELQNTQASLSAIQAAFFKENKSLLYDGSATGLHHFTSWGDIFFGEDENSPRAEGVLEVRDGVLSLTRSNTQGRYRIVLVKYRYNGRTMDHLPENPLISGMRNIVLSFEAKATKGSHVLALSLKYGPAGGYETRNYVRINENRYAQHEVVLRARPDYKASLYIDNQDVTDPGSSVQIKDLKLYEVQPSDER